MLSNTTFDYFSKNSTHRILFFVWKPTLERRR